MAQHESTCVQEMETALRQRVFGQDEAIATVSRSLCRQTTSHRPLGSFLFFGSPGVGKGTFAQVLAEYMFGSAEACISMGAWEFMDSPNAQRFGSVLTEAVQQQPAAVICLEEIEKGHPLIFDVLMQILAEGQWIDDQGYTVDFTNTILIMTTSEVGCKRTYWEQLQQAGGTLL